MLRTVAILVIALLLAIPLSLAAGSTPVPAVHADPGAPQMCAGDSNHGGALGQCVSFSQNEETSAWAAWGCTQIADFEGGYPIWFNLYDNSGNYVGFFTNVATHGQCVSIINQYVK
ncbi:MAG TPA: hypothetical protein VFB58_14410 [Chloroflexota bacterium]|nr:hypothetical protein [Chloroflexota bacterium]